MLDKWLEKNFPSASPFKVNPFKILKQKQNNYGIIVNWSRAVYKHMQLDIKF